MITDGFAVVEKLSAEDINEIIETGKLLSLGIQKLELDKTVPGFLKSNRGPNNSNPKKSAMDVSKKRKDQNSESIIDTMDSLVSIFNPDHKDIKDFKFNTDENFSVLNNPELDEQQAKKRKRNDISRKYVVKYKCEQCDYETKQSRYLRNHVESVHEGVRYPCNQCDYKATREDSLKQHKEYKHEGVRYSCDECGYKATTTGSLQRHVESIHEGLRYPCDQCDHKATSKAYLKKHIMSKHHQ